MSAEHVDASGDSRGHVRGAVSDIVVVLATFLVLGLVCGLIWWLLVDPATFTKVSTGGSMGEAQLGKRFDSDGWYVVVAVVAGVLAGAMVTWWRSRDFLLTTALLVVGAALAATAMALTGHLLGPGKPAAALAIAKAGQHVPVQLSVTSTATYLVWPIAVLIGALLVLWSTPRGSEE